MLKIYPYKMASRSAKELAKDIPCKRVWANRKYNPKASHIIVNWGSTQIPKWSNANFLSFLNHPSAIRKAVSKIETLTALRENNIPTVDFTTDRSYAQEWLDSGVTVVCRHTDRGYGGLGIEIVHDGELPDCPLYTKFVSKAREYRVHVFDGEAIDKQQKKRRRDGEQDGLVKNVANGWVFCRESYTEPDCDIESIAIGAVRALGLDFGGVDVMVNRGVPYVLEINTACGLTGTTLSKYKEAILKYENKSS